MTPLASLLLGAALGLAHAAAGLGVARLARGIAGERYATVVLGGTALRLFLATALVLVVLLAVPVQMTAFVLGLGVTFVIGLVAEVLLVLRRPAAATTRS